MNELDAKRLFAQVDADGDCWHWTGCDSGYGYGVMSVDGRQQRVHRLAYEHLVGPIPDGLVIDHLCRNRRCVNPDHLEPVTNGKNVLRGAGITARAARQTHCHNGHELTGSNLIRSGDRRRCRVCTQQVVRASRERAIAEFRAGRGSVRHGTSTGYRYGCRCEPCQQVQREQQQARRARRSGDGR